MKYIVAPPEYDEPDVVPGSEPRPGSLRVIFIAIAVFWAIIIGTVLVLYHTLGE